jgi:hypothetical protein
VTHLLPQNIRPLPGQIPSLLNWRKTTFISLWYVVLYIGKVNGQTLLDIFLLPVICSLGDMNYLAMGYSTTIYETKIRWKGGRQLCCKTFLSHISLLLHCVDILFLVLEQLCGMGVKNISALI